MVYLPYPEMYQIENNTTFGIKSVDINRIMRRNQRVFRRKCSHMFLLAPNLEDLPLAHSDGS